jgi:FkbM family methyltransferase
MTDTRAKTTAADPFGESITQSLLVEKSRLELAMRSVPGSLSIRTMYFEVLNRLSQSHLGWFFAVFPEINTPLLFRSASSDLFNLQQIYLNYIWGTQSFYYGEYGFDIPRPNRILDLGAYCGYTAVYFANRFPEAQIICVEPSASSFRLLLANTAPYPNIRCLPAAVWHERAELKQAGQLLGDWGNFFSPTGGLAADRVVPGYMISDILQMHGWTGADFIKCVVEDASVPVLSNPVRPWLDELTCVATKPVAGSWPHPDDETTLRAAFPDEEFEQSSHGAELIIFTRRSRLGPSPLAAPPPLPLIPLPPQTRCFTLSNLSNQSDFYRFDDTGIQFAPSPADQPLASVTFRLAFAGHRYFHATIRTGPAPSGAVMFSLRITSVSSGVEVLAAHYSLAADSAFEWAVEFTPLHGQHETALSAQKAEKDIVWVQIVDAKFQ